MIQCEEIKSLNVQTAKSVQFPSCNCVAHVGNEEINRGKRLSLNAKHTQRNDLKQERAVVRLTLHTRNLICFAKMLKSKEIKS